VSIELVGALAACTAAFAAVLSFGMRGTMATAMHMAHPDASALADAGWRGGLRRWEAIRASVMAAALALATVLGAPAVLAAAAASVMPSVWIRLHAETARERARRSIGRILASAESALRSGVSLPDALRRSGEAVGDELASRPIRDALRAFELGAGLDAALTAAARRCADARARVALGSLALGIAERLPRERMADLVAAVADRATFEDRLDDEVRARAAGARQQQRLLAVIVPALALYLSITTPTLSTVLASDLGRFVLIPAALALEVAGILLGRHVTRSVLR
jgi:Flp pilus assembly protein TadB